MGNFPFVANTLHELLPFLYLSVDECAVFTSATSFFGDVYLLVDSSTGRAKSREILGIEVRRLRPGLNVFNMVHLLVL